MKSLFGNSFIFRPTFRTLRDSRKMVRNVYDFTPTLSFIYVLSGCCKCTALYWIAFLPSSSFVTKAFKKADTSNFSFST